MLGRVIERASGMPYTDYVRTRVLEPVGATRTQQGGSRMADARPDDVGAARIAEMTGSGAPFACGAGTYNCGAGWFVNLAQGDGDWWHGGSTHGATAWLPRTHDGVAWIGLFDGRTVSPVDAESELDATLWKAFTIVTAFPTHDLFSSFR